MLSPPMFPLARSTDQLLVLGEVFCSGQDPGGITGVEIARRTGVSQSTVSRELGRLADAGWIHVRRLGTAKVVEPVTSLPIYIPVRQLIASTIGVLPICAMRSETIGGLLRHGSSDHGHNDSMVSKARF